MSEFETSYYAVAAFSAVLAILFLAFWAYSFYERLKALKHYHSGGCVVVSDGPFFPHILRGPRSPFATDRMTFRWQEPEDYDNVRIATDEEIKAAEKYEDERRKSGVEIRFVG